MIEDLTCWHTPTPLAFTPGCLDLFIAWALVIAFLFSEGLVYHIKYSDCDRYSAKRPSLRLPESLSMCLYTEELISVAVYE